MPHVLSLKPVRVSSLSGHSAAIAPEKPTFVPPVLLKEALAAGCVLCNEQGEALINGKAFKLVAVDSSPPAPAAPAADEGPSRSAAVKRACDELLTEGNPANLNSMNGLLKVGPVSDKCGFKVSVEEIRDSMPAADAG